LGVHVAPCAAVSRRTGVAQQQLPPSRVILTKEAAFRIADSDRAMMGGTSVEERRHGACTDEPGGRFRRRAELRSISSDFRTRVIETPTTDQLETSNP
jgi:hypothetical protein